MELCQELNPADACPSLHERQPLPRTDDAQDDVLGAGFIQRDELVVDFLGRADQRAGHVGRAGLGIGEDVRTAGLVRCLRHIDRPLPHRVEAVDRVFPVLLVLRDVEVARDADFHWIVGAANGPQFRPEEFDPLLDQIRAGKLVEQEVEIARRDLVDRWLTARTHPDRWPRPLRGGLDDDILEIPELAMMGEAPFGSPRLEGPERKHRKGPYNPEIGAPMDVGTNA